LRVQVLIRPKEGILDPQGQTVEQALQALGFSGVRNVHVGRLIELDVDNPQQVPEMCERLLANPLIEDYEVTSAEHPAPRSDEDVRPPAGRDCEHTQPARNAA
jgi:phosphoribosylformylglycinamidine synthase subunit PurS